MCSNEGLACDGLLACKSWESFAEAVMLKIRSSFIRRSDSMDMFTCNKEGFSLLVDVRGHISSF